MAIHRHDVYGAGGFRPDHPSGGVVESVEWDDEKKAGTLRKYDADGDVKVDRALTKKEAAAFTTA